MDPMTPDGHNGGSTEDCPGGGPGTEHFDDPAGRSDSPRPTRPPPRSSPATVPTKVRAPSGAALPRERLEAVLSRLDAYRVGLVVAPAGSGKTTLLARLAATAGVPVAWYRAEEWDAHERSLVAHLRAALTTAVGFFDSGDGTGVDDLLAALDGLTAPRIVLAIDDLHALEGTPAEAALERFLEYAPSSLTVLVASRVQPAFNLSRWRVSGGLVEIGAEDLRFRPWEVEQLFREHYGQQVPPQELAVLARRTEGWAAGLQLFHLATRSKSPDERRRILAGLTSGSRLTREYLARNVLGDLTPELRHFLVETSVLGRLSGSLCDALLGSGGSRAVLEELERRQIFTTPLEDEGEYRYHEVLRSHLLTILVDERGEAAARGLHERAGTLLEAAGAMPEALSAYSRGEDWTSVERVLGRTGETLISRPGGWLDALPPGLVRHDPWLLLASARHARNEGRWTAALDAYQRAERAFGSSDPAVVCRRERIALASWLDPLPAPGTDWAGLIRAATVRDPATSRRAGQSLSGWPRRFVTGLSSLLAGNVTAARDDLRDVVEDETTPPAQAAVAAIAAAFAERLMGDERWRRHADEAIEAADRRGLAWFSRVARAVVVAADGDPSAAALPIATSRHDDDAWGEAIVELGIALVGASGTDRAETARRASTAFRRLGATTLDGWARALIALGDAEAGAPSSLETARQAETAARTLGLPGSRVLAFRALAAADAAHRDRYETLEAEAKAETGFVAPSRSPSARTVPVEAPSDLAHVGRRGTGSNGDAGHAGPATAPSIAHADIPLTIRCLGGFSLLIGDRPVDLSGVKPRARAVLRFLALHAGTWVHREVITEALWPDGVGDAPARSLHVAVSTLRSALDGTASRPNGAISHLARDGDAYRLEVPEGSSIDVLELESAIATARTARIGGDVATTRTALRRALDLYAGELLPEDGPATWLVEPRERYRTMAVEAAQWLAELAHRDGEAAEAVAASLRGLAIDRYSDPLWRLLIDAREAAGDHGAALRARRDYEGVLAGLGVRGRSSRDPGSGAARAGA
jgi:DNA-binding SARP family transcriptional activator